MIITATEVQDILNISGQEDQINKLIPFAEDYAFSYTHNYFHTFNTNGIVYFYNDKIEIVSVTKDIINIIKPDVFLHVGNTFLNNGLYKVVSISGNVITIDRQLQNEQNSRVNLYICIIPEGYKIALANIIGSLLDGSQAAITSEKIGDYSYTVASADERISQYFNQYRKAVVI